MYSGGIGGVGHVDLVGVVCVPQQGPGELLRLDIGDEFGLENSSSGVKNSSSDEESSVHSSVRRCWTTLDVSPASSEGSLCLIGDLSLFLPLGDLDLDGLLSFSFVGGSVGFFFFSQAFF